MSELGDALLAQVERLLADHAGAGVLRTAEQGAWPRALWAECVALGLPDAMAPAALGGSALGWVEAGSVWRALGRHGAPVPLGEAMLAGVLLGDAGLAPEARYGSAPEAATTAPDPVTVLAIDPAAVPWGRAAHGVALVAGGGITLSRCTAVRFGTNLAGEPRDAVTPAHPLASGRLAAGADAGLLVMALLRACQIAGALETALALTVDYANTRRQFGRAIGGFQAVQQALAVCAGEVAQAGVAAAHACRAVDRLGLSGAAFEIAAAKIVAGEAAGIGAATAHQVHAAIGFTAEYDLQLYTRRLWAWRDETGSERYWATRIGAAALTRGGAALWPDLTAREEGPA